MGLLEEVREREEARMTLRVLPRGTGRIVTINQDGKDWQDLFGGKSGISFR